MKVDEKKVATAVETYTALREAELQVERLRGILFEYLFVLTVSDMDVYMARVKELHEKYPVKPVVLK